MNDERINLLPPDRLHTLKREYVFRVGVVACLLVAALFVSAAILLLPTHYLITNNVAIKQAQLARLDNTLSTSDDAHIAARFATFSEHLTALTELTRISSVSMTVRAVLHTPHSDITLSTLTYARNTTTKPSTLTLSGIAATRDALHNYQRAIEGAGFARSVELPVSAYAKDVNIPFTIAITLLP